MSRGLGSSPHDDSVLSLSSSSMISLHRSMHSSQMYTPGPAMSFLTCFWLLPQKEHFRRSPVSPIRAMLTASRMGRRACVHPGGELLRQTVPCRAVT